MPLNEPKNQAPLAKPLTAEPLITPAQHRENRLHESEGKTLAEDFARAINQGVTEGKLSNG